MDTLNDKMKSAPVPGIKDKYLDQLHSDFQLLSEIVLTQIKIASSLVHDSHNMEIIAELKRNEKLLIHWM